MQFAEPEILELTQGICHSVLNMDVQTSPAQLIPASLAASVGISGGWQGQVLFEGSQMFARRAAAVMFDRPTEDVTIDDMHDAVAELTNMVGGNLKSILPGPSKLSVPKFVPTDASSPNVPGAELITQVALVCNAEPIRVSVFQQ